MLPTHVHLDIKLHQALLAQTNLELIGLHHPLLLALDLQTRPSEQVILSLPTPGTFKQSKGDYSTAIMVLAGLSAFTCVLTANFKEPCESKRDSNVISRKSHGVAV